MTSSTVVSIFGTATSAISSYFTTLLPVILPVAVGLAVLFGILHWVYGASRRK